MRFREVHVEAFGHALPEEVVTSDALEERLLPLYDRLRVSVGRLELMSGIAERRFWPPGTRPSEVAARAGRDAIERSGIDPSEIGVLIHGAVCRDFLEPATASVVHGALGLSERCAAFDLSNACLGVANGMVQVATMIEAGAIRAGLVVAGEDGRPLVEQTIRHLLADDAAGRDELKRAYASLTIGSGAAAVLLTHADFAQTSRRLIASASLAATEHVGLCQGDLAEGGAGPLMDTDSEALLKAGNALAVRTFASFLEETGWTRETIDAVVTHQVGAAHKRLLFESLELDTAKDHPTVGFLGNVGSVSLPISYALAEESGALQIGQRTALLGIGSGLHCAMLAVH